MKTNFILGSLIFLITSCGNPHISTVENGLERTNPPLTLEEEDVCSAAGRNGEIQFFFGNDENTSRYSKCKSLIKETFNSFPDGETFLITNQQREDHSYELIHQNERNYTDQKVFYLEDIFGTETFPMTIENPVTSQETRGQDRGVDSTNADEGSRDSLIWSFSSPISVWSIKVVSLESSIPETAKIRLFDCNRALIKSADILYSNGEDGKSKLLSLGFTGGSGEVCHVALTSGNTKNIIAADEFIYSP